MRWGTLAALCLAVSCSAALSLVVVDAIADDGATPGRAGAVDRDSVQPEGASRAIDAMRKAAGYYHGTVQSHGGYVYHYALDLQKRWGEGEASKDQIWVQPPGTPTVGMAYLDAWSATGDAFYRQAALDAGHAIVYGQLKSGGWTNAIDFDPSGGRVAAYRNGRGRGRDHSTLDDGISQSAMLFLIRLDEAVDRSDTSVHGAVQIALKSLVAAQLPNGGFPQVWTSDPPLRDQQAAAGVSASYPKYDWRTENHVKEYWNHATLNDNVCGYVAQVLIEAHRVYGDQRYLASLKRLGDFMLLAQMPLPQPGFAQQYSKEMHPAWARKFEPPAMASDETQEAIATLILIAETTGQPKYLQGIPAALQWLGKSRLPDGSLARYYELQTNRPLYMNRNGKRYFLTYDDSDLPRHYGWKIDWKVDALTKSYRRAVQGMASPVDQGRVDQGSTDQGSAEQGTRPLDSVSRSGLQKQAAEVIDAMDSSHRWVDRFDGRRLVGQMKLPVGTEYLSSETFANNLTLLSRWVSASKP
ncbi:Pectic acid lyase [Rubripirellula lacrimiformis]|uniref:Pectic acid lyase n=1 Tax=Rubripirellula lacrimiformis TaxID=1930273 RepID=A0A517N513_9BACT|nr:pectate lyase [Rubripirellula lacrimiformis]QDT02229.1 Pectic acid lyase [Rubripirellula lacrimiformis]